MMVFSGVVKRKVASFLQTIADISSFAGHYLFFNCSVI